MPHRRLAVFFLLGLFVLTVGLLGCSGSDDPVAGGNSQVRVLLTDAPSDSIAGANVTVSRVDIPARDSHFPTYVVGITNHNFITTCFFSGHFFSRGNQEKNICVK